LSRTCRPSYYTIYMQLQNNCLMSLPDSFADFTSLVDLDLSHNALTSLPPHFFALPALSNLNISHKSLIALPFGLPFDPVPLRGSPPNSQTHYHLLPTLCGRLSGTLNLRRPQPLPTQAPGHCPRRRCHAPIPQGDSRTCCSASWNLANLSLSNHMQRM
jgi:Leucine-rich repeat (LRR) protein